MGGGGRGEDRRRSLGRRGGGGFGWLAEKRAGRIEHVRRAGADGDGGARRRRRHLNRVWRIGALLLLVGPGPGQDSGGRRIGGFRSGPTDILGRAKTTKSSGWRSLLWAPSFSFCDDEKTLII